MKDKYKKIIAQEGLLILGIIGGGTILLFTQQEPLAGLGAGLMILGYPAYLIIRFIVWAIKVLLKVRLEASYNREINKEAVTAEEVEEIKPALDALRKTLPDDLKDISPEEFVKLGKYSRKHNL